MATNYYKAVGGITDGISHYSEGEVFAGTETLDAHFEETGGKSGDRVLYEKSDRKAYDEFTASRENGGNISGSPEGVVGFAPTGEDSLVETQKSEGGDLLEADPQAGKPEDGEPIPPSSPEAERRLAVVTGDESAGEQKVEKASGSAKKSTSTAGQ